MKKLLFVIILGFTFLLTGCDVEEYTVTFNTYEGSSIKDIFVEEDTIVIEPSAPTYTDHDFLGWYLDEDFEEVYDFDSPVKSDLELFAKWEKNYYLIEFYSHEQTIEPIKVLKGGLLDEPDTPLKEGYTFLDWHIDNTFTTVFDFTEPITEDITIYLSWELNLYWMTFDVNGGSDVSDEANYHFDVWEEPEDPIREGYMFDGWYLENTLENEFVFGDEVSNNVDLFAKWILISELNIVFVPSRDASEIYEVTEPLKQILLDELSSRGVEFTAVNIYVASSYESAAEGLVSGLYDVGFLPGGVYVLYKDIENSPIEVILAAGRGGLSKTSTDPVDWNDGVPLEYTTVLEPGYNSFIIAGTSVAARAVADKLNGGETLVWDDLKDLNWCVRSATSNTGYIYPNLWLYENFGKQISDLTNITVTSGYGATMSSLAEGTCDLGLLFRGARIVYESDWTENYGRADTIWNETDVIGITQYIISDAVVVNEDNLNDELITMIKESLIEIIQTEEGLEIFDIYSFDGFIEITDEDYDPQRDANDLMN